MFGVAAGLLKEPPANCRAIPVCTRNTAARVHGIVRVYKLGYRTRETRDLKPAGFPVPVPNPNDFTIFNWTSGEDESVPRRSMFATSPKAFGENNRSIVIRICSDIFEKCKTLIGAIEDKEDEGEEDEESGGEEDDGSGDEGDEGSQGAIDRVRVAEDGLHMPMRLLELQTPCIKVGNGSYELDLGSVIITENDGVKRTRDTKIFVSEKKGTYYEAFNLVPSFRSPGRLRFYVALMEYKYEGDGEIQGILLVSRENELEKHRVIMNRVIGIAGGSSNGRFSDPVCSEIIIA